MFSLKVAFEELVLRRHNASPLIKRFLTSGGWQDVKCVYWQGRRSRGGWGGFSPPTFEEDGILFCFRYLVHFIQANYFKKYLAKSAVNTISGTLDFKNFWGRMPPDPPTNSRLRRSFSAPPPPPPPLLNTLCRP